MSEQYINKNINKNINKYLVYAAFSRALFYLPVFMIFYNELGIPYGIIMSFFSIMSIVKFILEVPSGSFADNIGRKKTVCISMVFKIISILTLVILALFFESINELGYVLVALSTICFGLAEVLESGATDALVYDYLKYYNKEDIYKDIAAKTTSLIFVTFSVSGIVGGALYNINISLPYIFTIVALIISFISILTFDEINMDSKSIKEIKIFHDNLATIVKSLKDLRTKKYLTNIMIYGSFLFSYFLLINWQLQILFKYMDVNIALFGIIFGALNLVSSLFSRLYPFIENNIGIKKSLFGIPIIFSLTFISLYFADNLFLVIILSMSQYAIWGYSVPLCSNLLNKNIDSETRSTMISIQSLFKSVIYGVLSPIFGFLIDLYSIKNTFIIVGILIFITLGISIYPLKNLKEIEQD